MEADTQIQWKIIGSMMFQCLMVGLGGYSQSVLNIPLEIVQKFVHASALRRYGDFLDADALALTWSAILSAPTVGALFGSFFVEILSEKYGRRNTVMIWSNLILVVASAFMVMAQPLDMVSMLLIGRLISGICLGISSVAPVFLLECAPKDFRGSVAAGYQAGYLFWQIVATILGLPYFLGTHERWPILLGLPAIFALIHLCLTPLFHESPSYLYSRQFSYGACVKSMHFYHGPKAKIENIMEELEKGSFVNYVRF